ncbi:LacI family DNA-binding transcriptional regulator [Leucobacter ruminantium]|uniref:LacI family DNA-binding transcriptional regulator n=1 Tax=Leucobacter ruminantium TaxID=1289170 RepID=A0A939M2U7_9MICO|nr:LacI family DNA-binding transcriptional regulator [Leucobacter ruminantium]MBO1805950.1 LacI family DNA-binding transcriptional regulator [Leucobacter ruminantium]
MNDPVDTGSPRPTIYDVAKRAGVSHMTVSRVLNGHPNIRDSTRERVDSAIRDLGYQRSASARALAMRSAMRLGALVDSPVEYGPNSMLRSFERAARDAGYSVGSFTTTDEKKRGADAAIESLLSQDVDGLCVIAPRRSSLRVLAKRRIGVPTILVVPEVLQGSTTASVDQYEGARLAVGHLIGLGHRRIAHLAGPGDWHDARERVRGWRDTLTAAGLAADTLGEGDWTADSGYRWARSLEPDGCTAVFAGNDQMALGVMHGLSERGIRVPHDVSVVGFDDIPDSRHYLPPLTTVRQDFAALGALAVGLLLDALRGDPHGGLTKISPELIARESTAKVGG